MIRKLLIANRGEIALRIVRAARDLDIESVAIYARDDAQAPHLALADASRALSGSGPAAYLEIEEIVAVARDTGCDAVHPGYGFLSERAPFARACEAAGVRFVGPAADQLELFGDKARALMLARECKVPIMPSTHGDASLEELQAFFDANPAGIVVKAVGGGGGRGMRAVTSRDELPQAWERARSEARAAFGLPDVYGERLIHRARHVEIQIVGDGRDVVSLGERDCTLQRRFQKLVEVAPAPGLSTELRAQLEAAALAMARACRFRNLGTFEFLVDEQAGFVFIEANPRLQVEHTVTEAVTGLDLVALQLGLAGGASLRELGLDPAQPLPRRGHAIQFRVCAETIDARGLARPGTGTLTIFDAPTGPGVRVDTNARAGAQVSGQYDSLLAKVIVSTASGDFAATVRRAQRALAEFRIEGVATNLELLRAVLERPAFAAARVHTRVMDEWLPALLERVAVLERERAAQASSLSGSDRASAAVASGAAPAPGSAVPVETLAATDEMGHALVRAPMAGRIVEVSAAVGAVVSVGTTIAVLDAMKMEHPVEATLAGRIMRVSVVAGEQVAEGQVLAAVAAGGEAAVTEAADAAVDPSYVRPDLQRVLARWETTRDAARPHAVARRNARGQRMARENVADLCDTDSFAEYGAFAVAAQTRRRSMEDLIANTPADGMITGVGSVNGQWFGPERSRCVVMSYDATVLAGTQGFRNHKKTDRMLELALRQRLPVVFFAEGGGGRPGDVDMPIVAGLDLSTFASFARLSGEVPVVGIVAGRCFAGNAALVGCADVLIATRDSNLGMGGPAMIEGGGLGVFRPEDIGPSSVQHANGVIDVLVDDETQAVAVARHYLSMFQGARSEWQARDERLLRQVVPENRLRVYDTRAAIEGLVDEGSLLMLRTGFGAGIHTALARIEGRPVGVLANNPAHLSGAIDADAADKAARFMQLCDAHGLPLVSLIDTPGFMVGPAVEEQAQVRHVCRMFVVAAKLRVPFFSVVLRKGYGLGAMAMAAGGFHAPAFTVAWPTGEFGGMGLEGAVRLGFKKELEAEPEGAQRDALYERLVARQYEKGAAMNMASTLEIDAVIDPADTRRWLVRGLESAPLPKPGASGRFVDTW